MVVLDVILLHLSSLALAFAAASLQNVIPNPNLEINSVPLSTRVHWMRQANAALPSACPFGAFGTVIVNHTSPGLGQLVCSGANARSRTGNPILHGEIVAIQNCSAILTDPSGPFKLTPSQALNAFAQLSLYTNAESCSMCASAIRWSGFREYIYGSNIEFLVQQGWDQIRIPSIEVFKESFDLPQAARLMGNFLTNETDPLFVWQNNPDAACPNGCHRSADGSTCTP